MPRAIPPQGQTNEGHKKAARDEPHLPDDVVFPTAKMFFSYLRTAGGCPKTLPIAEPSLYAYFYVSLYHKALVIGKVLTFLNFL